MGPRIGGGYITRLGLAGLLAMAVIILGALPGVTGPGSVDPSFSDDGIAKTDFGNSYDAAYAVAVQPGGRIIAGGVAGAQSGEDRPWRISGDFGLAGYLPNGLLDPSFGTAGKVTTGVSTNTQGPTGDHINALTIQTDGKIVAGGEEMVTQQDDNGSRPFRPQPALVRYLPNGALDPSFGTVVDPGVVKMELNKRGRGRVSAVTMQGERIVAAGQLDTGTHDNGWDRYHNNDMIADILVMRFLANGSPDPEFNKCPLGEYEGCGGYVVTTMHGPKKGNDEAYGVVVKSDGIVVAGRSSRGFQVPGGVRWDALLVRYNENGSLDTTFGTDGSVGKGGSVITSWGPGDSEIYALALQTVDNEQRLVVAGRSNGQFALARYSPAGALDTRFGLGGIVKTPQAGDAIKAISIQPDNKIVAAGGKSGKYALARYLPDGGLDTTFGSGGMLTTSMGDESNQAEGVVLQGDGKPVVVGTAEDTNPSQDFGVVRYLGPIADLAVTIAGAPDPVPVGGEITYAINVNNSGPDKAIAVRLTNPTPLPPGATYKSVTTSEGTCANAVATLVCALGDLTSGATATVTAVASVGAATPGNTVSNTVAVKSDSPTDENMANNQATEIIALLRSGAGSPPATPGAPTVTGLDPTKGPVDGGTSVGVTGTLFAGATQVSFGGAVVSSHPCPTPGGTGAEPCFTQESDTRIVAYSPRATAPGVVHVTVQTPKGVSAATPADLFTYFESGGPGGGPPGSGPAAAPGAGAGFATPLTPGTGGPASSGAPSPFSVSSPGLGSGHAGVLSAAPGYSAAQGPASGSLSASASASASVSAQGIQQIQPATGAFPRNEDSVAPATNYLMVGGSDPAPAMFPAFGVFGLALFAGCMHTRRKNEGRWSGAAAPGKVRPAAQAAY